MFALIVDDFAFNTYTMSTWIIFKRCKFLGFGLVVILSVVALVWCENWLSLGLRFQVEEEVSKLTVVGR
jgi:hypothetical protein